MKKSIPIDLCIVADGSRLKIHFARFAHFARARLQGHIHAGLLQSAQYVYESVWDKLQQALALAPGLPILITGVDVARYS